MADMANDLSKNSRVYDRLSFRLYDCHCPRLDTEWLLSTLFDASLLSTSKAAGNGGSFFAPSPFWSQSRRDVPPKSGTKVIKLPGPFSSSKIRGRRPAIFGKQDAGNHKNGCGWTLARERAMICSS